MADINRSPNLSAPAENIRTDAAKYDISCTIIVTDGSQQSVNIGSADPAEEYTLDCTGGFLLGLSVLILTEAGALDPAAPVSDYIPAEELPAAAKGTCALNLLRRDAGLPDPLHGILLPRLHRSAEFAALDSEAASKREAEELCAHRSLAAQTELLRESGDIPNAGLAPSPLDEAILAQLVRQLTGLSAADFVRRHILVPLGISDRSDRDSEVAVRLTSDDLTVMLLGITEGKLPGDSCMAFAGYNAKGGHTLPFGRRQEILCARSRCGNDCVELLMNTDGGIGVLIASHAPLPELRRGDCFTRLDIEAAAALNAVGVYPSKTRMERLSQRNIPDALVLEPGDGQSDFVSSPAAVIADVSLGQGEAFVIREGRTAVGLLTFAKTAVPGTVLMDTLIIDRRYQRRGFGRIAVKWAAAYLRGMGTDRLLVCVDRRNKAARALYGSCGFKISEVHNGAYVLEKVL